MTSDKPVRYVELHCHTNFSMLDGASTPEAMLEQAKAIGMESLAITDHNGLYGIVKFWRASLDFGIKPIFGVEMDTDEGFHILLLAKNMTGYSNLCRMTSRSHLKSEKGHPSLSFDTLKECSSDLFCLSACRKGEVVSSLVAGDMKSARAAIEKYQRLFGEDFWIEIQNHLLPDDTWLCEELVYLGRTTGTGCVATNDVHYATPEGRALQDVLTCIKHQVRLDEATGIRYPNSEYYLKTAEEMGNLFARFPEALENTNRIAEACNINLDLTRFSLPSFEVPKGFDPQTYQDRLELRVKVLHRLQPTTATQEWMDHIPLQRTGPDNGNLHHDIFEAAGLHFGQGLSLRPALDLKYAYSVRFGEYFEDSRIIERDIFEVQLQAFGLPDHLFSVIDNR